MWFATIDFIKAFDSISHHSIWKVLEICGIEQHYISLLRRLFTDQQATVLTDKESDKIRDQEEDKALQVALKSDLTRLQKKKETGICLGDNIRLLYKFTFCWRCALVSDVIGAGAENDVWIQAKHGEGGTKNPPKKKNLQQPKLKLVKGSADWQHQSWDIYQGRKYKISWTNNNISTTGGNIEIKDGIRVASASFYKYKQELTTKSYSLQHRLRLFNMVELTSKNWLLEHRLRQVDAVITPTMNHASGTLSREHMKMIQPTQRKMLWLILQTKRKNTQVRNAEKEKGRGRIAEKQEEKRDEEGKKESQGCSEEEIEDGYDSNSDCDQDSDISFMNDTDDEIAAAETEEEWIEYMKRSTEAAIEQMKIAKIPLLDRNKRMKWRLAMRIASMSEERWARKAAEWNLGLSTKYKTYRAVGRPKKMGRRNQWISQSGKNRITTQEKQRCVDQDSERSERLE